jgi:hypothetical protein
MSPACDMPRSWTSSGGPSLSGAPLRSPAARPTRLSAPGRFTAGLPNRMVRGGSLRKLLLPAFPTSGSLIPHPFPTHLSQVPQRSSAFLQPSRPPATQRPTRTAAASCTQAACRAPSPILSLCCRWHRGTMLSAGCREPPQMAATTRCGAA